MCLPQLRDVQAVCSGMAQQAQLQRIAMGMTYTMRACAIAGSTRPRPAIPSASTHSVTQSRNPRVRRAVTMSAKRNGRCRVVTIFQSAVRHARTVSTGHVAARTTW
jgi:hypothetical protein